MTERPSGSPEPAGGLAVAEPRPAEPEQPSLEPCDRVPVRKGVYRPSRGRHRVLGSKGPFGPRPRHRGSVLPWLWGALGIEQPEDEDFTKRVIGLPGETIELHDGTPSVDAARVPEPSPWRHPGTRGYGPGEVPDDALLGLADNRTNPNDSRSGLGFNPRDKVIGRALSIAWPPSRVGWIH